MSPELINPSMLDLEDTPLTKESDCYALGMVIYEVLSGQRPFALYGDLTVIQAIVGGERPRRPWGEEGKLFTDDIWGVLECCWKPQPHDRMNAEAVLMGLEERPPLRELSSNVARGAETNKVVEKDGGVETDSDEESEWSAAEWHSAVDDCMFSPIHPRLVFNSPSAV